MPRLTDKILRQRRERAAERRRREEEAAKKRTEEAAAKRHAEEGADKKLAEELIANIDGVTEVDNQLTIVADSNLAEDEAMSSEDGVSELTDAKIATVIKTRLLMDSDISGFDIDVDVENGNVTLTGSVDSDAERDLAVEIAKSASDVMDVENNLTVTETSTTMKSE